MEKNIDYTVIAYTTSRYYNQIDRLKKSLEALKIKHHLVKMKDWGERRDHGLHRPTFIINTIEKLKTDVLYVDADAVFTGNPIILNTSFDVGITKRINEKGEFIKKPFIENWNFATFFRYTKPSLHFIKVWKYLCDWKELNSIASDHTRLNWTRKILSEKYTEIYMNSYFSNNITGYINGGKTAVIISKEKEK